ncbi:MAG: NosD domain-containing protein, partial [Candidatus Kariarchaeaceae archaeon]
MSKGNMGSLKNLMDVMRPLSIIILVLLLLNLQGVHATDITVCGSGCDNSSIQDAIDAATGGDNIIVGDGTYNENIDITKSVNVQSANGSAVTTINANVSTDHVIHITVNDVNITGFTVSGAGIGKSGVYFDVSDNCNISNNKITSNYEGLAFFKSNNNLITRNNVSSNDIRGLRTVFNSNNNNIFDNYFSNNTLNVLDGCCTNKYNTTKQVGSNIIGGSYLGGNYWDDYTGIDNDADGLGDTNLPYNSSNLILTGGDYLPLTLPDVNSPVLSNIKNATVSDTSAVITWLTDQTSNSLVKFNTSSGSYKYSVNDSSLVVFHRIVISGLSPNTMYYYVVNSTDESGNSNQSVEYTFRTGSLYSVCKPSGCDYTTIQGAVTGVTSGDRIFVYNGTYIENVVLNKSITLEGQDKDSTIIDCSGSGNCIKVEADGVEIRGFTGQNGTIGVLVVASDYIIIRDNTFKDNKQSGVYLTSSNYGRIGNNAVVQNSYYYGIGLNDSSTTTVENNNASENWYGIYIYNSCDNTINNNLANDNTFYGIYLSSSSCSSTTYSNNILNNTASANYYGIVSVSSSSTSISYNTLTENYYAGILRENSTNDETSSNTISGGLGSFTTTPLGSRIITDNSWLSASNNATFLLYIDNFGLTTDNLDFEIENRDSVSMIFDNSSIILNPGETTSREMKIGNGTVGEYTLLIEVESQTDSTANDNVKTTSIITNST